MDGVPRFDLVMLLIGDVVDDAMVLFVMVKGARPQRPTVRCNSSDMVTTHLAFQLRLPQHPSLLVQQQTQPGRQPPPQAMRLLHQTRTQQDAQRCRHARV